MPSLWSPNAVYPARDDSALVQVQSSLRRVLTTKCWSQASKRARDDSDLSDHDDASSTISTRPVAHCLNAEDDARSRAVRCRIYAGPAQWAAADSDDGQRLESVKTAEVFNEQCPAPSARCSRRACVCSCAFAHATVHMLMV
jgi:hypothetical protein